MILPLVERGSLLRAAAREYGKTVLGLYGGLRRTPPDGLFIIAVERGPALGSAGLHSIMGPAGPAQRACAGGRKHEHIVFAAISRCALDRNHGVRVPGVGGA